MITPRRTRLVRVPDLHTFRRTLAALCATAPVPPVIIVPTASAVAQLERTLSSPDGVRHETDAAPLIVTRDGFYDLLHARMPGAPRRLTAMECDSLAQAAARAAAAAIDTGSSPGDAGTGETVLPFRLRPGLVSEMLRFYDQLRRQSQRLERFNELIEETLGGTSGDRGADRLLAQTRFLNATFRTYERLTQATGAWDEHALRERVMRDPIVPAVTHVIVTLADWIADPDGLFIGDFDLLARMPGLERLDLVCTEAVLGSGFHQRLHDWWPGIDEEPASSLIGAAEPRRPLLEIPAGDTERLWFTERDREEELAAVAQRVKAARRRSPNPPSLDRTGVVYKRPLPYLYLASSTLGAAGLPFWSSDALPLAGEPFLAAVDLALAVVESTFAREDLVALVSSPYLREPRPGRVAIREMDAALRDSGYLGELPVLDAIAAGIDGTKGMAQPAFAVATRLARELEPLGAAAPASIQVRRLRVFVETTLAVPDDDPFKERARRGREAVLGLLLQLEAAHVAHHDPDWTIEDLGAAVRRWIEEHTFVPDGGRAGIRLLDDRAARYADVDALTIVGLVESEWPERQARNIFYPSSLLKALGWPSESTRRRAADARFLDLLASPAATISVSTVTLDDDAIVLRSMQLDEMPRARLATAPASDVRARITVDEALALDPLALDGLEAAAREWADVRLRRTAIDNPAYHGAVGDRPARAWAVSALEAYLTCPFKFFAQHVLRLEEEPEDAEVMDPRQQGQFVHKVFELFFARWHGSGRGAITPDALDQARAMFTGVVDEQVRTLPEGEAGLERTRLLGSSAAAGLGEAVLRMEAERPTRVVERLLEHRLDGPLELVTDAGSRVVEIRGKADRIDLLEDGTFRLIDYKLGWPPQRSRALQLPVYALAAERRLEGRRNQRWTLGEAAYLAFKGPKRVVPLPSAPAEREKVMRDAQQRAVDAIDAIARGEFPPHPEDVYLCETCSYAAVCRKDYVGDV